MSHTNLITINSTEINNSGAFRVGDNLSSGTAGQVLKSNGDFIAPSWETDIDTTYQGSATIDIDTTTDPDTINVIKVPNSLTFTGYATGTFDGSSALNINLVDTTYTAGNGIQISGSNQIQTKTDNQTIRDSGGGSGNNLEVLKVPNDLTFTGYATGTFNGSAPLSINLVDTDTTYQAGAGIIFNPLTTPESIEALTDNITINKGFIGNALQVVKVPNKLTFTGYATTTYDGSAPVNINLVDNDHQLNLTGALPMIINNLGGYNREVELQYDNITLGSGGGALEVLKVPNKLTCGANLAFITGTDYDGSAARQIYLTKTPTGFNSITMSSTPIATTITGNTYPSNPTHCSYLDLTSSTNVFPKFVGGCEILKSLSYIDNTSQNYNLISNTAFKFFFDGSQTFGTDTLEIDFTATSTTGYCEYGFFANSYTSGIIFMAGIAVATGGTSPFSTTLGSGAVSIDAYKLGLFDGTTTRYSLKEILDFDGYENTYITSQFYFNNLSIGTRYRMALYGRCWNTGSIYLNTGGKGTSGLPDRSAHQPAFMKFYEYDSSIGGARPGGGGGGGGGGF